jgi:lysyl-tRNA synthetase class 2
MTAAQVQRNRGLLKTAIRDFFSSKDYEEVDTPALVPCPGTETFLQYFCTTWQDEATRQQTLWLRSSPELHMKQLLAQGMERIYQIAPSFRNHGEFADWHSPEFTMLEWYRAGASPEDFIEETCELLRFTANNFPGAEKETIRSLDQVEKWTVKEIFKASANIDLVDLDPKLGSQAVAAGLTSVNQEDDFETAFFKILIDKVEPFLQQFPLAILYDYPASQAALSRIENGVAKRFEVYCNGIELSNGFWELTDHSENRARYKESSRRRKELGFSVPEEDRAFFACLEKGLPSSCGNALGFDRWLAILQGDTNLDKSIPFRKTIYARELP